MVETPMGLEDFLKLGLTQLIILPVIGFFAAFGYKWFLQDRKARDELMHALVPDRVKALRELWRITSRPEIEALKGDEDVVPPVLLKEADAAIMEWYRKEAEALFLSWHATDRLFRVLDVLRRDGIITKGDVKKAVSALRTRLKYDCGFYSYWDVIRRLKAPEKLLKSESNPDIQ
jgi:hypothetical protein